MTKSKKTMKLNTSHYAKCRTLMVQFKSRHRIRLFLTSVILFANCYFHVITLPILYYGDLDRGSALLWGIFAFLINLVIFVTVFFTSAERLKLVCLLLMLILVGTIIGFLHPAAGITLGLLFLSQLPECMKMRWIQKQQGYPYFNERYEQQMNLKRTADDFILKEDEEEKAAEKNISPKKRPPVRYNDIIVFSMPDEKKR